jgi:hypothetical protein
MAAVPAVRNHGTTLGDVLRLCHFTRLGDGPRDPRPVSVPWPDVTGLKHPTPTAEDGLTAARARAAELGVSVSEYVRDQLRRARAEEAWERALAQAGEAWPPAGRE